MAEPIIALESVSKVYPGVERPVLDDLSLSVGPGEAIAIVGPSGSGKSTLLNLMGALDRPTSGRITLNGADLSLLDDRALARVRNDRIGFIFQSHHLLPQCSAIENILVPTLVNPRLKGKRETLEHARELLSRVGMAERMNHRPAQLSGGECQRVAVVRALINEPTLVLADEPTGSLDAESAQRLGILLRELNRERGVTLIVVTHSAALSAMMQRRCTLRAGRLREEAEAIA